VKSIILDTSPILTNTPTISSLLNICDSIYTVPSVIDEVKDSAARSRLETTILPFLTTRTPKSESIQFTSQFSSKTGDRSVLSETDIQVLALAYELECEQNGGDWRLRRSPGQKGPNGSPPKKSEASPEGPTKQCVDEQDSPDMNSSSTTQDVPSDAGERPHEEPPNASVAVQGGEVSANLGDLRISEPNLDDNVDISQPRPGVPSSTEDAPGDFPSNTSASDSEGWITPSNMKKQQAKDQNASTVPILEDRVMQVATISGDFAMQVRT